MNRVSVTALTRPPAPRRKAARTAAAGPRQRPLPPTARGQRTRQAILDAAERILGEQGYHEAGIAEITQAAGVAMGTFYVYFPDKRAVFADLVRLLNARLRADIQSAVAALDDRIDKEVEGFSAFFAFSRRHRNLYRVIRQAEFVDEPLYRWHYQTIAKGYVKGLRAAQARGQIEPRHDPEILAYALMGMAEAVGMRFVLWERRTPPVAVTRTLRRIFESGLRPAAGRAR